MSYSTTELLKFWFIMSCSLGCWTCLNLLLSRQGDKHVKRIIAVFVLLLLAPPINAYITLASLRTIDILVAITHSLTWTYGPILLLLIQHILLKKIRPLHVFFHALPFPLALTYQALSLNWIPFGLFILLLFVQVFSYLGYALYLLIKNRQRIISLSAQHKNTTYYWLLYLIGAPTLVILIDLYIFFNIYLGNFPTVICPAFIASAVGLYVNTIALFALYQPAIFFHESNKIEVHEEAPAKAPVLRITELSPDAALDLSNRLQKLVAIHKPHLDDSISLAKLASLLEVTPHQLSELLNVHKAVSFYDFLNELRHQEALSLLSQRDITLTIADIAYQSGFNNRNSFYKIFKEKTGVTPTQYQKLTHENASPLPKTFSG